MDLSINRSQKSEFRSRNSEIQNSEVRGLSAESAVQQSSGWRHAKRLKPWVGIEMMQAL